MERKLDTLLADIKKEQQISPFLDDSIITNLIYDGIYDIEENIGKEIDFESDKKARALLKNYVLYANHKRLAEFKKLYGGDYIELQRKYYINTSVQ